MILETSAIVAIALKEPGFEELLGKLVKARNAGVGVPTLTETAIVLSARLNQDARGVLSRFLIEGSIATVPFGDAHFSVAVDAWLQYGKGRQHGVTELWRLPVIRHCRARWRAPALRWQTQGLAGVGVSR